MDPLADRPVKSDRDLDGLVNAPFTAPDIDITTPVAISAREQISTMLSIRRKPPEMPFEDGIDAALADAPSGARTEPVLSNEKLLFGLASLVLRREQDITALNDPRVSRGFQEVALQLRMFEHLNILVQAAGR
jgi:hypothetical protein